jgi:hypothetical protein
VSNSSATHLDSSRGRQHLKKELARFTGSIMRTQRCISNWTKRRKSEFHFRIEGSLKVKVGALWYRRSESWVEELSGPRPARRPGR